MSFKLPYDKAHLHTFVSAKELKEIEEKYGSEKSREVLH